MRSLWKKREETHQVLYPEGRREERRKGGGLELVSLLLLSGVQGRDVAVHHCHCSLLRCLHKLTVNLGNRNIGVIQTSTNQVTSCFLP